MSVKAFDIAPCVDKIQPSISCMECCGKTLYVGAADSFVLQYLIEERTQPNGSVQIQCTKQAQKYLGLKKPISVIKSASALNRLLVLCDGTIFLLSMFDLEIIPGGTKIKGVINFCLNQDPLSSNPFSLEICVAHKRSLQVFHLTEDKAVAVRDVSLSESPCVMAMDGKYVCLALATKYAIVDFEVGSVKEVFPYDSMLTAPLVVRVNKEEFLLSAPNALGIFVTSARTSERPPLPWSESVHALAFAHPYVVAMDADGLLVYSILDQQQKQRLQFGAGRALENFDGRLLAATSSSVYTLLPVSWEKQVRALLDDRRVNEALELAGHCHWPGITREQFSNLFGKIQQEAGFIALSELNLEQSRELFVAGHLDPRELICLYPGLLSAASGFIRSSPPLHGIASFVQLCQNDVAKLDKCRQFLTQYLEDVRETKNNINCRMDVDVALLKLYAESNSPELMTLIVASHPEQEVADCADWLRRYGRFHALASLYSQHADAERALDVWLELLQGMQKDDSFPGLTFVVEYLTNLKDHVLLWKYAGVVLEMDAEIGVRMFTERPSEEVELQESSTIKPDRVVDYLQQYPQALLKYLEYLVFIRDLKSDKFHTHLATLYLDIVLKHAKDDVVDQERLAAARQKLQHMLRFSSSYRVKFLLARVQDSDLHLETAILFGKQGEHERALRLLVHREKDPQAARDYCQHYAHGRDTAYRQQLFHTLLGVYLDPALERSQQYELIEPALCLLNSELAEFDAAAVLKLLPGQWSASMVDAFLMRAMRKSVATRRLKQIEKNVAKVENVRLRLGRYAVDRNMITLTEEGSCAVCGGTFSEASFAHFPNGEIAHIQCSQQIEKLSKESMSRSTVSRPTDPR